MDPLSEITEQTHTFDSWDGAKLFYRSWIRPDDTGKAVILLHRGHEHSGRVERLFKELRLDGFSGFAYDMRGHGRSEGERGYADNYDVWTKDLNAYINHIRDTHGILPEKMAIVASSVGAVNAVTWVHDYGVSVRCLVLAAPAFRIRLYVPLAIPLLRLLWKIMPRAFITSYVRSRMLTHDEDEAKAYDADPLITRRIAVSVLIGLHDTARRILADAGAITTPTLVMTAGSDYVVENRAQFQFVESISSVVKEHVVYPNSFHGMFHEVNRQEIVARTRAFIFAAEPGGVDESAYTRLEYERLRIVPNLLARSVFGFQRVAMRTLGRLSRGIALGWDTGFNSGRSLDHVYRNQAEGRWLLGRLIDRCYLNAIGWRGIRLRKESLQRWIAHAADRLTASGRPVRIMDVASGPGRYLLELKRKMGGDVAMLLRDQDQANLESARTIAETWGLQKVTFLRADAFDPHAFAGLPFAPNIVVVSGLYELFPDNRLVLGSLRAIFAAIAPGGYLVYTGQPWHPQLEMIARTLVGSDGKPWVMRRRTQVELNALVGDAGFTRVDSSIDPFGIFTVSLARKGEQP